LHSLDLQRGGFAMQPSAVRSRILSDHQGLRRDLQRLETLLADIRSERMPIPALHVDARALLARLHAHMHWEEVHLLPALRDADAWGAERADQLVRDHCDQRELLEFLERRLDDSTHPAALLVSDVTHLIALLRDDMRHEESELLDERVLRDDVVAIDVTTG
jgi:hypothetical protein